MKLKLKSSKAQGFHLVVFLALAFLSFQIFTHPAEAENGCCVIGPSPSICYADISQDSCLSECQARESAKNCALDVLSADCSKQDKCSVQKPETMKSKTDPKVCMYSTSCSESRFNQSCCTSSGSEGTCQKVGTDYICLQSSTSSNNTASNNSTNNSTTTTSGSFSNPLKYDSVNSFAANVLSTIRSIVVVLSIIFLILGGIFYITSAGNDTRMTAAKGAITASMIGLAIGVAAPSFLKEVYSLMGGKDSSVSAQLTGLSLTQIALNFLNFLLSVVGILTLIMLIVGGIMYLTSAGDDDRTQTAKKIVTYSIIGIAISLASLLIVKQIASLLK